MDYESFLKLKNVRVYFMLLLYGFSFGIITLIGIIKLKFWLLFILSSILTTSFIYLIYNFNVSITKSNYDEKESYLWKLWFFDKKIAYFWIIGFYILSLIIGSILINLIIQTKLLLN